MLPNNKQITEVLLTRWPTGTIRTKQLRADADTLLTEHFSITNEEKEKKHNSGPGLFSSALGGALNHYGHLVDLSDSESEQEIKEDIEVQKVRKADEFSLRDCDGLAAALLGIGLRKDGTEYSVPDYGRIDVACSEISNGEFTSVELKVVDAGNKEASQACKYLAFQERIKGYGKAGRVVIIAPLFDITFWCVAKRFPEIQAYSYVKNEDGTVTLTQEKSGGALCSATKI